MVDDYIHLDIREVYKITGILKGSTKILISAVDAVTLWKGQDTENYVIRKCHNLKEYREVFYVRIPGRYVPSQLQ